jgi:hypothetical protein
MITKEMMSIAQAFKAIRSAGAEARYEDGEWRVNLKKGREATAYYTTDREDAVDTAIAMVARQKMIEEDRV